MGPLGVKFTSFCVFCLAVFVVLRLLARKVPIIARLSLGLHLLATVMGILVFLPPALDLLHPDAVNWARIALLFLSLYAGLRLLDFWLFEIVVPRQHNVPVPLVLRDIVRWIIMLAVLLLTVRTVFPQVNLNVIAVSSIVVGYILGNASQDTLGNLISGLAMNTERPFAIGDWVEVGGHTGRVEDMSWRATTLRTKMEDYVIIPNAVISRDAIVNYSRPTGVHCCVLEVGVNYGVPPNTVKRVLLEVLGSVPEVLAAPAPDVRLTAYGDFSINYRMCFFIADFARINQIQSAVMFQVWYHFKRAGIAIPFPIRDVNLRAVTPEIEAEQQRRCEEARLALLSRVELFSPLSESEKASLAGSMTERIFAAGERLVRQGEEGDTFYIVMSGRVAVTVEQEGQTTTLAKLGPGDFFGEMSILTGERRSATVTAENDTTVLILSHTAVGAVIAAHEKLAGDLAAILARRRHEQAEAAKHLGDRTRPDAGAEGMLLARIRRFFRLG